MKQYVSEFDFSDAFNKSQTYKDNFSYDARKALFEYLEQYESESGEDMDFDMVSIACDYTEYENLKELQKDYSDIKSMEDLQDNTTVIMIDDQSFIIQVF